MILDTKTYIKDGKKYIKLKLVLMGNNWNIQIRKQKGNKYYEAYKQGLSELIKLIDNNELVKDYKLQKIQDKVNNKKIVVGKIEIYNPKIHEVIDDKAKVEFYVKKQFYKNNEYPYQIIVRNVDINDPIIRAIKNETGVNQIMQIVYRRVNDGEKLSIKAKTIMHNGVKYVQFYLPRVSFVIGNIKKFEKSRVADNEEEFKQLIDILKTDPIFKDKYKHMITYMNLIYTGPVKEVNEHIFSEDWKHVKIKDSLQNSCIYSPHFTYEYQEADTFKDMFKRQIYERNSCLFNIAWDNLGSIVQQKLKRKFDKESMAEIMGVKYDEVNGTPLTITELCKFLDFINVNIVCYSVLGIFYKHGTDKQVKYNGLPRTIHILFYNVHAWIIPNTKEISQKALLEYANEKSKYDCKASSIMKHTTIKESKKIIEYIESIDDIPDIIKEHIDENSKIINFMYEGDLLNLVFDLIDNNDYTPKIQYKQGIITSVSFKISNIYGMIQSSTPCVTDRYIPLENNEIEEYSKVDNEFSSWLKNDRHMSYHHPDVLEIENKYKMTPVTGSYNIDYKKKSL